jgi:hypothetical protein
MGGVCSVHGSSEKCVHNFGSKTRREETTRKSMRRWRGGCDLDRQWAGVNLVTNIRVP